MINKLTKTLILITLTILSFCILITQQEPAKLNTVCNPITSEKKDEMVNSMITSYGFDNWADFVSVDADEKTNLNIPKLNKLFGNSWAAKFKEIMAKYRKIIADVKTSKSCVEPKETANKQTDEKPKESAPKNAVSNKTQTHTTKNSVFNKVPEAKNLSEKQIDQVYNTVNIDSGGNKIYYSIAIIAVSSIIVIIGGILIYKRIKAKHI